ncbi:MAG: methylated-DNA--[protein]-cysteine S-methyltransferase [Saprospiraceae bacterium]|nr:methylated-DNA--[protein]-cysteine S-methyltransferase [Saprospiraceae bacterium]
MSHLFYDSPVGILEIEGTKDGISAIRFVQERQPDSPDVPVVLTTCAEQLREYFTGHRTSFNLKLDLSRASQFHREVWRLVQAIPYGRTRSYSTIARTLERPGASRAVGQANGRNPIPIVIPCHRVIGKNGGLRGYAYGLKIKEALLAIENPRRYAHQPDLFEVS